MADLPRQDGRTSVMHIITRLDRGGSARNTFLTVMGHDRSRFRVSLVYGCVEAHGAEEAALLEKDMNQLRLAGVALFEVPSLVREVRPLRDAHATLAVWRILRKERPAIIHTHTSKAGAVGRVAAWLARVPIVIHTPHGHVFYGYYGPVVSGLIRLVERVLARITDRIVTLTERGIEEHVRLGIARADKFTAIPSGIALSAFRSVLVEPAMKRKELGLPPEGPVIGTVGRLVPIKGHEWLLKAAPLVLAEFPHATFVFLGEGPLLGRLQQVAGELGISGRVMFLGARQDVPECLAAFDLFAFPSLNEGMGRALIEAMAVGLPVIATRVGGIPDVVTEGVNGLLVPPENAQALADSILALLRDPGRMEVFGEAASRSVGERFEAASTIREIERLYDAVWHEKHVAP